MSIKKSILVHRLIESSFLSVLKEVPEMSHFDYMVDSIKGAYFDVLVDKLYNFLNFVNIPKEKVRPIDIKEKLNSLGWCTNETKAKMYYRSFFKAKGIGIETLTDYLFLMEKYLRSDVFKVSGNSRVEQYKNYLLSIFDNKEYLNSKNNYDPDILDDLSAIFIAFLYRDDDYLNNPSGYLQVKIGDLPLTPDSYDWVYKFFIKYTTIPKDFKKKLCDKKLLNKTIGFLFDGPWNDTKIDLLYSENDIDAILKFMYIYCTLFICRILQKTGVQVAREEND